MLGNLVFPGNISLNMISICILARGTEVDMQGLIYICLVHEIIVDHIHFVTANELEAAK